MNTESVSRVPIHTGGCQCDAIRFAVYSRPEKIGICHSGADEIAKIESYQHPDHDTGDDWKPRRRSET